MRKINRVYLKLRSNILEKLFKKKKKLVCGACKDSGKYCSYCERGGQRPYA